ncbi:MAG: DUF47 family protein [Candidatus Azobacteroides pseudotrichonymphae]|jgi:predicted phosphate transport protein (TIGR00153 family)|uniref:Pit accessory protein n=1 Tax=Azobacteroides pseudotrichonymphae genomovar. CFP2 TaxID=511995 RepID=B6YQM7_AZOPC|nr:DUF47 family protein [Candidatus Azobacteroides pseudotrichonymphae]BAG83499.1 putative pit accessory protein [Candidatus Azobacteroides pseudotrichonymphae genomovar. CFP2]GMO32889.1 MAG: DUF47 family protein [Candidatus Azobacteroides pseudotrichonymphae]
MKINNIFSVFTPKNTKFFFLLNETAIILDQAGDLLIKLFSPMDKDKIGERNKICKLIKGEELKGDRVTHQIFKTLNETFIVPFDREDISTLADEMDNAIDTINRSAHKVLMYVPEQLPNSTLLLAKIIKKETSEIKAAIGKLSSLKTDGQLIRKSYKAIKAMEKEADMVYEKGIVDLFHSKIRTFEIMKLKEIIQELEKSTNKINDVGKVIKNIFIKYT